MNAASTPQLLVITVSRPAATTAATRTPAIVRHVPGFDTVIELARDRTGNQTEYQAGGGHATRIRDEAHGGAPDDIDVDDGGCRDQQGRDDISDDSHCCYLRGAALIALPRSSRATPMPG